MVVEFCNPQVVVWGQGSEVPIARGNVALHSIGIFTLLLRNS